MVERRAGRERRKGKVRKSINYWQCGRQTSIFGKLTSLTSSSGSDCFALGGGLSDLEDRVDVMGIWVCGGTGRSGEVWMRMWMGGPCLCSPPAFVHIHKNTLLQVLVSCPALIPITKRQRICANYEWLMHTEPPQGKGRGADGCAEPLVTRKVKGRLCGRTWR